MSALVGWEGVLMTPHWSGETTYWTQRLVNQLALPTFLTFVRNVRFNNLSELCNFVAARGRALRRPLQVKRCVEFVYLLTTGRRGGRLEKLSSAFRRTFLLSGVLTRGSALRRGLYLRIGVPPRRFDDQPGSRSHGRVVSSLDPLSTNSNSIIILIL